MSRLGSLHVMNFSLIFKLSVIAHGFQEQASINLIIFDIAEVFDAGCFCRFVEHADGLMLKGMSEREAVQEVGRPPILSCGRRVFIASVICFGRGSVLE